MFHRSVEKRDPIKGILRHAEQLELTHVSEHSAQEIKQYDQKTCISRSIVQPESCSVATPSLSNIPLCVLC